VPSLVKIGPVVLEKKSKMKKFTDRRTPDNGQSEKLTRAFSSSELKMTKKGVLKSDNVGAIYSKHMLEK
jgi:hypothetical protein